VLTPSGETPVSPSDAAGFVLLLPLFTVLLGLLLPMLFGPWLELGIVLGVRSAPGATMIDAESEAALGAE
jgi:hypothetical protein